MTPSNISSGKLKSEFQRLLLRESIKNVKCEEYLFELMEQLQTLSGTY